MMIRVTVLYLPVTSLLDRAVAVTVDLAGPGRRGPGPGGLTVAMIRASRLCSGRGTDI